MIRAVLDANVYVSTAARPEGPGQIIDPELWFEDIVVLSHLVAGEQDLAGASKDPDDDKYIATAIEGRARFVVAGDSDLLDLKEYDGIRIVSPRVFLGSPRRLNARRKANEALPETGVRDGQRNQE
jgi:predicted nucleic acid-binding protein